MTVIDDVIERTEGTTASFVKELVRRATYVALETSGEATITDAHLLSALDEMLTGQPLGPGLFGVEAEEGSHANRSEIAVDDHPFDHPPD